MPTETNGVDRWHLLQTVRGLRARLGLTCRDLIAFEKLLGFLPPGPITPSSKLVVFPSNATLEERTGIPERSLRRVLARLSCAGLIVRKDSATGKRFPLRGPGGHILDAYGFDLTPAFAAYDYFLELAREVAEERAFLRLKRAELQARRKALLTQIAEIPGAIRAWVEEMTRILRRNLTRCQLTALEIELDRIAAEFPDVQLPEKATVAPCPAPQADERLSEPKPQANPSEILIRESQESCGEVARKAVLNAPDLTAGNGQNDRLVEAQKNGDKIHQHSTPQERPDDPLSWGSLRDLSQLHPEPKTTAEMTRVITDMAKILRLPMDSMTEISARFTPWAVLRMIDLLIGRSDQIHSPGGYVKALLAREDAGEVTILARSRNAVRASMS